MYYKMEWDGKKYVQKLIPQASPKPIVDSKKVTKKTTKKEEPEQPDQPEQPEQPEQPDQPDELTMDDLLKEV